MRVTCTKALRYKQDKYPYICDCTCNYNYDYPTYYPLYKYLLKYSPKAYILESFALVVKQCKQVFYLPGIGI
jgi:hypothetical protein